MRSHLFPTLILCTSLTIPAAAQLPRIVVQGNGAPAVFTAFDAAVAAAEPGDRLYLSGGSFNFPGNLAIDKELHLIGAGIHPDSTQVTGVTTLINASGAAPLRILSSASGSTFTGIRITTVSGGNSNLVLRYGTGDSDDDPTDVVFQRCWFQGEVQLGTASSNGATTAFDECIFHGQFDGKGKSGVFTRCIIANGFNTITLTGLAGSSVVENCVVLGTIQANNGVIVRNSFLRTSGGYASYSCTNCTFQNNITPCQTVVSTSPGAVLTNNLTEVVLANVFVSETNGFYEVSDDLHMAPGSPGAGHGTDGNDVGVYGTASPYKPGAVPFNPHYIQADIAPSTSVSGALPVNIRVAAQQH